MVYNDIRRKGKQMKHARWFIATALVLAALAGCSLFQKKAELLVVNNSSYTIGWVYIRPVGGDWSDDLLGSSTIASGSQYTITGIKAGTYDLDAWNLTGTLEWPYSGAVLEGGETFTWTLID
jgi:hypothetical protein